MGQDRRFLDIGTIASPSEVVRKLDNGQEQRYGYEYNAIGKVCKATDPLGGETRYTYGTNNVADAVCTSGSSIDILKVEQKNERLRVGTICSSRSRMTVSIIR